MSKYTDEQLKAMAIDTLCAYNLGDPRADMLIQILSQASRTPLQFIIQELNKLANKVD